VAFAPVNPLAAPWQARGLDWLLMPEDLPPELSLCVMPDAVPAAPVRRPQPAAPRAPRPVRPLPSQLQQEGQGSASAAPAQAVRQGGAPVASPAPAAPAPEQRRPARPQAAEQAPETAAPVRSWPPHVWPAVWQERLSRTRQGRVVWTYWNLGPDLCEAQAPGKAQRSAFFRRLMQDLAYPAGTSTFWPACLPDPDAMPASPAPAEGEDRPRYQPNADVFWSGVQALHARAVVVMGSVAARALGLPAGVRPLQQLRHRGTLVWVLWDVEFLLDEPQRYAAMLAFVRRALQQISRR